MSDNDEEIEIAQSSNSDDGQTAFTPDDADPQDEVIAEPRPKRMGKKRSIKSGQANPKLNSVFETMLGVKTTEQNLFLLFEDNYEQACTDDNIISESLSAQALRIIVRVFKLVDPQHGNPRKAYLCANLKKYLASDEMREKRVKFFENRDPKNLNVKKPEKQRKASENSPSDNEQSELSDESEEKQPAISTQKSPGRKKGSNKDKDNPEPRFIPGVTIPRLKYDATFNTKKALDFITTCNKFIWELSERISEMERALTILNRKLDEIEQYYGL